MESLIRHRAGLDFLRAEIGLALVFAKIASDTDNEEKRARNLSNARNGYDTLVYFSKQLALTREEHDEIMGAILELRRVLAGLGEGFDL